MQINRYEAAEQCVGFPHWWALETTGECPACGQTDEGWVEQPEPPTGPLTPEQRVGATALAQRVYAEQREQHWG